MFVPLTCSVSPLQFPRARCLLAALGSRGISPHLTWPYPDSLSKKWPSSFLLPLPYPCQVSCWPQLKHKKSISKLINLLKSENVASPLNSYRNDVSRRVPASQLLQQSRQRGTWGYSQGANYSTNLQRQLSSAALAFFCPSPSFTLAM